VTDNSFSKWPNQNCEGGPEEGPLSSTCHRETADDYAGELFRHGNYRVALCRDRIQWLFQRQRPNFPAGGVAWDTLGYCVSKSGLVRLVRIHIGSAVAKLDALPDHVPRRCSDGQK
jgi:hypothetical protein